MEGYILETTHRPKTYTVSDSATRIDAILNSASGNFSDSKTVPNRSVLTYTNGFYVSVTSLFIDIVASSELTNQHERPVLAKIYRSFISECVAIINSSDPSCEVTINGDCVWGVFDTPYKSDIDTVFNVAAKLNSLMKILNYKLMEKGYKNIKAGIGIDYGRALIIKAGYDGSGLNEVVWMGDVVNQACHLANQANRNSYKPIIISPILYDNLNSENQKFCNSVWIEGNLNYECNIVDVTMEQWYRENCK